MTRAELINHLEHLAEYVKYSEDAPALREAIKTLKCSEMPNGSEERTQERTETHACDLVSRQDAITEFSCCELTPDGGIDANYAIDFLKHLPSVQPDSKELSFTHKALDTISRQAAIDFIDAGHLVNPNEPRWSDNEVVNFLKSRPSAQPEQRWIPCSEMMPVSDGIYIVDDYRHGKHWIHTVGYMKRSNSWCEQHGIYYDDKYGRYDKQEDIIAWMPLPEPYKERWEDG